MKIPRLFTAAAILPTLALASHDLDDWSLGPIGGTFRTNPGTSMLSVQSMPAGSPGATGGLIAGDRIVGAFGESFGIMDTNPTSGGYKGPVQDLGAAIDRAEANGGVLPLMVLRPGSGLVNVTVNVAALGAFGPAYPRGSAKYDALYQESCAQIHSKTTASSNGDFGYNTGWFGLTLLSHPDWNSTSGSRPYRNSINKLRTRTISHLNSRILAPVEDTEAGYVDPGLENWDLGVSVMFLAEYVNKTGDTSATVMNALQYGVDCLENRIQAGGRMGHGGVVGDYGNWALSIINVHAHAAFAMAKRAGIVIDQSKWDLSWTGHIKGATARSNGHMEDGYVDYGPPAWGQGNGYDASGRTAGAVFGFFNYGQVPTADDTDALDRMKGYLSRNYHRMQHTHAYTIGGVCFNQLALPYLPDRDQRYFMDNVKYFFQFHRTPSASLQYFGGRMNNGGDDYCDLNNVKLYNVAMAGAVANRGLPSIPAENTARIYADMKSPWTKWPTITARTATLSGLSHTLDVDICDHLGAVTTADSASWTQLSGPGSVTFGTPSSPTTTATFSQGGTYRLQLTATKGGYSLTELYDFSVISAPPPAGYTLGGVSREIYTNIGGGVSVGDLTSHPKYPNSPDVTSTVGALDLSSYGDNYGQRLRGFIVPPVTGNYTFYIASDDASQFRFNSSGASAAGASVACAVTGWSGQYAWTASPAQQSASYSLTAGQPYFFEVLHKEGSGGDHVAVAWTGPGISTPTVISGTALAQDSSAEILRQPASRTGVPGGSATFTTTVRGAGPFLYEWKLDGTAYWGVSSSPTLALTNLSTGAAGSYTCTITHPGGSMTTEPAVLSLAGSPGIATGGLKREVWNNLSGSTVATLTAHSRYPRFPDVTSVVTEAEGPNGYGDNYGQRLSGWVVAPTSGTYRFFIASDDASELWLSTDASPANKVKIAQITGWTSARNYGAGPSGNITLVAGQRYYIEALQKEGGGGDHLAIAWQRPGDPAPSAGSAPIPGAHLEHETFAADPEMTGLVSHWTFDEAAGLTAVDRISTGNDGTINGATWTAGKRLGGLFFDSSDQIHCGNAGALAGTTPFTVSAWVKVNAGNATDAVIIQQRAANGFNGQYQLLVRANGRAGFYCYGNNAEQFNFSGTTLINDGQWHHVAAVRDATGGAFIYIDGVLDGSVTGTTVRSLSSSINLGIGADIRDNNKVFRGSLDDVRVYNRALAPAEISSVRNKPPLFTQGTITGGDAMEDQPYAASLAGSAVDPDAGEILSYSKVSGPAWLSVAANGALSGTPDNGDVGSNAFTVRVTDSVGASHDALLTIPVVNVNDAPTFTAQPVAGAPGTQGLAYTGTLAGSAVDVDAGDTLSYSKVSGPGWLSVAANGTLSGTPGNSDVGLNSFTVRVTDAAGASAQAVLEIQIANVNDAPVFTANPFLATATEDLAFSGSISATDIDAGDVLTFTKVNGPTWLTVAGNGALTGTPGNGDVGVNTFLVRVTDVAGAFAEATLQITVANVNDAPTFLTDPVLRESGTEGNAYAGTSLAGSATDADAGDSVTYSKVSGPAWLSIADSGALSGTPGLGSAGTNTFTVRATDTSGAFDEATLVIEISGPSLPLPWVSTDIGSGMAAGSVSHAAGLFTVSGAGTLAGQSDRFHFVHQPLTGDGEIIARIASLQNTGTSSRVGVMIRDSLAANSRHVFMGMTGSNAYRWVRRTSTNGNTSTTNSSTGTVPATWVRLVRTGNTITAYKSANGTSWTQVGSLSAAFPTTCYIGLVVASGSTGTLNTSDFSHLSVTP